MCADIFHRVPSDGLNIYLPLNCGLLKLLLVARYGVDLNSSDALDYNVEQILFLYKCMKIL